ncbi:MAG: fructosamine kinase family protein [Caldilineales bacterium]|nr:fructosamine kinase family protein [Caldilineales bacterium]
MSMAGDSAIGRALVEALGEQPMSIQPLGGGCVGKVYKIRMADGMVYAAKYAERGGAGLDREAFMLRYLRDHSQLPIPAVIFTDERLLVMQLISGTSRFSDAAQRHAAELLADLHAIAASRFGFGRDTLIGGLNQPNPWNDSWVTFFAEHRLGYMADAALQEGRLPRQFHRQLHALIPRLAELLPEPDQPSLLHGDVWTTNVLADGDSITGFLDPAIYFGHPEIVLAFITLFNTFGVPFFERYHQLRPIAPGFWEVRRDIYNLYPLMVHVRLFGGGYVSSVGSVLARLGV